MTTRILAAILISIHVAHGAWVPPIGIPVPPFGLTNTHWIYTNAGKTYDFGTGAVAYPTTADGPYTHWVDNEHPSATDTANTYGSPTTPRLTFEENLAPGSVVVIKGTNYDFNNGSTRCTLGGPGTEAAPQFYRGLSTNARPSFVGRDMTFWGSYCVFENLAISNFTMNVRADLWTNTCHHLVIRGCEVEGSGATDNGSCIGFTTSANRIQYFLVISNIIHDFGDWDSGTENDMHGVHPDVAGQDYCWIVDNEIWHMGGDSVQIGSATGPSDSTYTYVGRNLFWDNNENAIDVKLTSHVVISENKMWGFKTTASSAGEAVVIHNNPTNCWTIFNVISNATIGMISTGAGTDCYWLGNFVLNCAVGGEMRGGGTNYWLGNTFVGVTNAIENSGASDADNPILSNIIYGLTNATGHHIFYDNTSLAAASSMHNNLLYQTNGGDVRIRWGATTYTSLSAFQSATSKGASSLQSDPLFVANGGYPLLVTSPAIGAGTNLSTWTSLYATMFGETITVDIAGSPISVPRDMGAWEYQYGLTNSNPKIRGIRLRMN